MTSILTILQNNPHGCYLHLDDAWGIEPNDFDKGASIVNAIECGPVLRYVARPDDIAMFQREFVSQLPSAIDGLPLFVLYGSGDFHHLAGTLVNKAVQSLPTDDVILISFDNHPDWAVTPPKWACGSWINRAMELPQIAAVHVWGCGNFELTFPSRLMSNRSAMKSGRLNI